MLDAPHVVVSLNQPPSRLDLPRSLRLPRGLDLPGSVWIALHYILSFDMLDARHVAFSVVNQLPCRLNLPRNLNSSLSLSRNPFLPGHLDLPGSVKFAVTLILIFDILDVPDVGTMVLFLPQNLQS